MCCNVSDCLACHVACHVPTPHLQCRPLLARWRDVTEADFDGYDLINVNASIHIAERLSPVGTSTDSRVRHVDTSWWSSS